MRKKEFRGIFSFPPTLLYRDDLRELDNIIADAQKHENDTTRITLTYKDQRFDAESLDELFSYEDIPKETDKLEVQRTGWCEQGGKNEIERGIYLTMHHNYVSCQIHSFNEDWYRGKISRLQSFFKKKRPWYHILNKISFIFPVVAVWTLVYTINLIRSKEVYLFLVFSFLALSLLLISVLAYKGVLFPYVKVVLADKNRITLDWNKISASVITISALVIILEFVCKMISKLRNP